jgi:hypothetical protein
MTLSAGRVGAVGYAPGCRARTSDVIESGDLILVAGAGGRW